jgi:predicted DNA-binding transcriptional regulator YafY
VTTTLQRLERLLTLVPWLLEHPGADVDAVATAFGVDREELLADLDLLGYCGLPGYGGGDLVEVRVVGSRVTVDMADFFRRPVRLSVREAVTLLLAARTLAGLEGLPESAPLRRAVSTLEDLLGAAGGGPVPTVVVDLSTPGQEHLAALRTAVAQRRVVRLVYRSAARAETTQREVEPWALVGSGGAWYLQGHCRLADGPRDFRLDRMRAVEVTDERLTGPHPSPAPPRYRPAPGDTEVVLDLDPAAWWVADWAVLDAERRARGTTGAVRRVTLRTPDLAWAARLVLRLAGAAVVVSPPALAARVADLATATRANYRK